MNEEFPKEIYQKACERLTPSSGSLREVYAVKKPKNIQDSRGKHLLPRRLLWY